MNLIDLQFKLKEKKKKKIKKSELDNIKGIGNFKTRLLKNLKV